MASFRRMAGTDYLAYDGAENLPDGTRPFISTRDSTEGYVTYLITGNGAEEGEELARIHISVHVLRPIPPGSAEEERLAEEEAEEWWIRELPANRVDVARRVGALLPRDADPVTLVALGFSRSI